MLDRRTFIAAAAALSSVAALPKDGITLTPHPDAELLAAFEEWKQASIIVEGLPMGMSDADREPYEQRVNRALDLMDTLPARTPTGVAAKLGYLFASMGESGDCYDAICHNVPPMADTLSDQRFRMLWTLIADVQRMAVQADALPLPLGAGCMSPDRMFAVGRPASTAEAPSDEHARRSQIRRDAEDLIRNGLQTGSWKA